MITPGRATIEESSFNTRDRAAQETLMLLKKKHLAEWNWNQWRRHFNAHGRVAPRESPLRAGQIKDITDRDKEN